MQLSYLRELVVFAKHENVSKAAEELFVSQPRLSQHLAYLEANLGFPLLARRSGKATGLTPDGKKFCAFVSSMLDDYDRTVNGFLERNRGSNVSLCITKPSLAISGLLGAAASRYEREHPGKKVALSLVNRIESSPKEAVGSGSGIVAATYLLPEDREKLESEGYETILVKSDPSVVLAPKRSTLANQGALRMRNLDGCVLSFSGDPMHEEFYNNQVIKRAALSGAKIKKHLNFVADYEEHLMSSSDYVSIVPLSWANKCCEETNARACLPVEDAGFVIDLYIVYRADLLSSEQLAYLAVLEEIAEDHRLCASAS